MRSRLRDAYEYVAAVSSEDVPNIEGLKTDIVWIRNELDRRFADCSGLDEMVMMQRFQNRTGVKIAERIHRVWCKLCQHQAKPASENDIRQRWKPGSN